MKASRQSVPRILLLVLMMSLPSCMETSLARNVAAQKFHLYKAHNNCAARIANVTLPTDGGSYCEPVWDNLMCWPHYVRAGEHVTQSCPSYIQRFNPLENASRFCTEDGTWEKHPNDAINNTWTDFRSCATESDYTVPVIFEIHLPIVVQISTVGYSISLATLIVATTIMVCFRKLRCPRNTIHINLFISFMLRATLSLLRNTLLVRHFALPSDISYTEDGTLFFLPEGTHWQCKLLNTLWQYSLNANYMWIFIEGLYLHTLIFFAIFSQSAKYFKLYIIIGWVFPLIFIMFWVIARIFKNNTLCWNIHDKSYYWILNAPIISSISINFFFFLNIMRVLFTKIRDCNTRDPRRYRKLAKATLVLIPLFGVYYIIFILLSLHNEPEVSVIHMYMEMTLNSFQGTIVALLFCFLNGEVRSEIRKKWHRHWLRRQSIASTRSSKAFSSGSSYTGRDRASLTQGLPLYDVTCKDIAIANICYSSCNGHGFHNVPSMPKLFPGTCPRIKSMPQISSPSIEKDKGPTRNHSFPVGEEQLQKSNNDTCPCGGLVESPGEKHEHRPTDILAETSTDNCEKTMSPSNACSPGKDKRLKDLPNSHSPRCPV
ncbi:hypothetical protein BsWGS_04308 [Bradybaena similaris]